jgi:hypothetical protein
MIGGVGFEVLTAMTMKIATFLDVMLCDLVEVHQHFTGTSCLQLQSPESKQSFPLVSCWVL